MKLTPLFEKLFAGEHLSKALHIELEGDYSGKSVRLAFITPSGRRLLSGDISMENGEADYYLPADVTDMAGRLAVQLFVYQGGEFVEKSALYELAVLPSADSAESVQTASGELITLATLHEELLEHSHDDSYYTKTQSDSLLSLKADKAYADDRDALKADITYVDGRDALKADKSYVDGRDALKADKAYVDEKDALKADITYVDSSVSQAKSEVIASLPEYTVPDKVSAFENDAGYLTKNITEDVMVNALLCVFSDFSCSGNMSCDGVFRSGKNTYAKTPGDYSAVVGGYDCKSTGEGSLAAGERCEAAGKYSVASGLETIAAADYQRAEGKYNAEDSEGKYACIVGNGYTEPGAIFGVNKVRRNAATLDWNGNAWFSGTVKTGGSSADDSAAAELATKSYVDTAAANAAPDLSSYATQDYVNTAVANAAPDLSSYATQSYVNTAVTNAAPDLSSYATQSYVNTAVANAAPDLSSYATQDYVNTAVTNAAPDLSSYAKLSDIPAVPTKLSSFTNDSGFITSAAVPTKLSSFTNDSGFITSADGGNAAKVCGLRFAVASAAPTSAGSDLITFVV